MNLFSIWPSFGFTENPYSNQTLPSSDEGDRLLVGREREVSDLQRRIGSGGTHPSVEGPTGVGKSSLIAVTGYRMLAACTREPQGTLFLPARNFMQLDKDVDKFEETVFYEIAQTLVANAAAFRQAGLSTPDLAGIDRWLNSPQHRETGGGITILGTGVNASRATEPNTSEGFAASGLPAAIKAELVRLFPSPAAGAVICVLDNLELLQSSGEARQALEAVRDRLINVPGLRWVVCGSRGIVSRARSERLSGVFDPPIQVGPLPDDASVDLISRRIDLYGRDGSYAPVEPEAFEYLYRALHMNLRDALAYAQQFADWVYAQYVAVDRPLPDAANDKRMLLEGWLAEASDDAHSGAGKVQRRVWQFFDALALQGGTCGASEWESFGFNTQQQHSSAVSALVESNLVVRATDPENGSRSHAMLTPQGWLVSFHRNRYDLPTA